MCGICGVVGASSGKGGERALRRMMTAIIHRGPDEEGILVAPNAAVGVRRLSIIDISGGSQPVWNELGTVAVFFNGEIYNFRELRGELERAGHTFRTNSDTEVIVHSYEEWGEACLDRLRGMFAFAAVEMDAKVGAVTNIFLARDRFGIKPLYYAVKDGTLLFASEVRALLASGQIARRLAAEAIESYLLFGSVGEPCTLVHDVVSLPPGHFLKVRIEPQITLPSPRPYWCARTVRDTLDGGASPESGAHTAHVRSSLERAVRSHLVADVPVGVFLSSGMDSAAIVALAARSQSGLHTFTLAFPDAGFSEAAGARQTAERFGSQHLELTLADSDMLSRLDDAVGAFDQPSLDGINTYFVSWAARQAGLKVALSGLGSDEVFGGYRTFRTTSALSRLAYYARYCPKLFRQATHTILLVLVRLVTTPDASRKALGAWLDPASFPHPYFFTRALFTPEWVSFATNAGGGSYRATPWFRWLYGAAEQVRGMDEFTSVSWLELRSYLVNTLLRDTDAMSMKHSLEVRVPFLDTALVEYVLALPQSAKFQRGRPKSLLRAALRDVLPPEVESAPKRTFTLPWQNWLRGMLSRRVEERLGDWSPALGPYVSRESAMAVWRDFLAGRTSWSRPWSLYVLNEWVKQNLSERGGEAHEARAHTTIGSPAQCARTSSSI